jgi:gamma-glutamyltranspeptidase/glutathione hydrolase
MAAMVNVTEPMMNGLGGDAFILVYWQGKLHGLNASGRSPQTMTRQTFVDVGWKRMPQAGWGSVSVPGAPDGYLALHERFCSKKFADLIEPAAAYAEAGFAVGQKIAHIWEWGSSKLRLSDHAMEEYLLQGRVPKPGEIFRQRNLARTWREQGTRGRDHFYEGELARRIVAASDAGGGHLKLPDITTYEIRRILGRFFISRSWQRRSSTGSCMGRCRDSSRRRAHSFLGSDYPIWACSYGEEKIILSHEAHRAFSWR